MIGVSFSLTSRGRKKLRLAHLRSKSDIDSSEPGLVLAGILAGAGVRVRRYLSHFQLV